MKFSLFENDKSTIKDELFLCLFILACAAIGVALVITAPSFWIIDSTMTKTFGVLCILTAVMFIPGLIYRLFNNDKR